MDNNVEKTSMFCDNCQDFGELPFRRREIWYYQLMIWKFINQRKPTTQKELKGALTIKRFRVEVSPEEAEAIRIMFILKSPTVQMR